MNEIVDMLVKNGVDMSNINDSFKTLSVGFSEEVILKLKAIAIAEINGDTETYNKLANEVREKALIACVLAANDSI